MCSVFASQSGSPSEVGVNDMGSIDSEMLDRALIFFERAKSLDPENIIVDSLLSMVRMFLRDVLRLSILMRREDPESGPGSKGSLADRSLR